MGQGTQFELIWTRTTIFCAGARGNPSAVVSVGCAHQRIFGIRTESSRRGKNHQGDSLFAPVAESITPVGEPRCAIELRAELKASWWETGGRVLAVTQIVRQERCKCFKEVVFALRILWRKTRLCNGNFWWTVIEYFLFHLMSTWR